MKRYVILNAQNQIVGRCLWDGVSAWAPPEGQRAMLEASAIRAGYQDAPPAAGPRRISAREFMDRLSLETQRAIVVARRTNADADLLLMHLTGGDVDLESERTKQGVAAMQAYGLITAAEAAALLA